VREGIRLSGIPKSEIEYETKRSGHVHLRRNGKLVVCSGSPADETIAARNIANELKRRT